MANLKKSYVGNKASQGTKKSSERTSYEIRQRWDRENLLKLGISLHRTKDADIIAYIDQQKAKGKKTSEIFRKALKHQILVAD